MAAFTVVGAIAGGNSVGPSIQQGARPIRRLLTQIVGATEFEIVSLRTPQFGIPLAQRRTMLQNLVANGQPSYAGFFSASPARDGTGGVEVSAPAYARVAHSLWRHQTVAQYIARRTSIGEIRFPTVTVSYTGQAWGLWDAATGGNLLAFGLLRGTNLQARTFTFQVGDTPVFGDGLLRFGIQ